MDFTSLSSQGQEEEGGCPCHSFETDCLNGLEWIGFEHLQNQDQIPLRDLIGGSWSTPLEKGHQFRCGLVLSYIHALMDVLYRAMVEVGN